MHTAPHSVWIYTEKDISQHIPLGHSYRPTNSAILFIKKGSVMLKEQINVIRLTANSVVLIDMKYVYEILEISKDIEIRSIAYDRSFIEKSSLKLNKLNLYNNLKKQLIRMYTLCKVDFNVLWKDIELLNYYIRHHNRIEFAQEIIENHFITVIYHLMSVVPLSNDEQRNKMTRAQQIVFDFILLVSEHYLSNKSVAFYAGKLGISGRHLSNILKQENGRKPNEIISEFILNEAKAQLAGTSHSINEIARNLQFSDQYAFSHFFKKHQKISPSQYIKKFRT